MKEEYWIQLDGTKIAIGDMDISHLNNTINMLRRKFHIACFAKAMSSGLAAASYSTTAPDGAAMAAEEYAHHIMSEGGLDEILTEECPIFGLLLEEQSRRGV